MRTGYFVEGLSNTERFLANVKAVENRGAPEACWHIVEGEAGFGKSRNLAWYAMRNNAVLLRAKADWTPRWLLHDFAAALNIKPAHRTQDCFNAVLEEIAQQRDRRANFCLIVDEGDHAASKLRVLETIRDLTDYSEVPLIFGGMKGARQMIRRFPQIYSRVAEITEFGPASVADVVTMCKALTDVEVAHDLCAEIQKKTGGRLRDVMNAIARVEAFGRRKRGVVNLEAYGNTALLSEDRARLMQASNG